MTEKQENPKDTTSTEKNKETDPQEHMEGPISSIMQNIKEGAEDNDESKEEADKKKDRNT